MPYDLGTFEPGYPQSMRDHEPAFGQTASKYEALSRVGKSRWRTGRCFLRRREKGDASPVRAPSAKRAPR